jgi:hypothetical protein
VQSSTNGTPTRFAGTPDHSLAIAPMPASSPGRLLALACHSAVRAHGEQSAFLLGAKRISDRRGASREKRLLDQGRPSPTCASIIRLSKRDLPDRWLARMLPSFAGEGYEVLTRERRVVDLRAAAGDPLSVARRPRPLARQSRYPRRTNHPPMISKSKRAFRGVERTRSLLQKTCWDQEVHSAMLPPSG